LALEVPVAIKFMQPSAEADADVSRRFLREARIGSALNSPHVAQVFDFGVEHGRSYMVMELLQGEPLARRLRRAGALSPQQTADILVPLAQALQRVHDLGVVHRDIKPDNVFIVQVGGREHPKLLDFGVAKARKKQFDVNVSRDTAEGERVGTPHYMSPEQARGATGVDHRSDVWALGVLAFECLLGYPPFVASGLGNLLLQICTQPLPVPSEFGVVPAGFDVWFARACARAPEARFSSVLEAARLLSQLCSHGRLEGPKPPPRMSAWEATWRRFVHCLRQIAGVKVDRSAWRWLVAAAVVALASGALLRGVANVAKHRASGRSRTALSPSVASRIAPQVPISQPSSGNVSEMPRGIERAASKK
jgi:serine/threonine protein kinase